MPLRLAIITGNFDSVVDGVALTLQRQVEHLTAHGIAVRVYAPHAPQTIAHDFPVVRLPAIKVLSTPYRFALGLTAAARKDLLTFQPTVVHVTTPDWLGSAAIGWANSLGVPVVATYFTHFSSYLKHYHTGFLEPLAWWLQRRLYRHCQQIRVPSLSMANELESHGIPGPFVISPFGVDLTHFSPSKRSEEWRRSRGVQPGELVILFVGRLVWEKGLRLWASAIRRLETEGVPHRSLIVGEGPILSDLRKLLPRTIFTGRLTQPELGRAFASSDLFFFPSDSETFGCVTVEALASGVPALVADATGSRDIVQDGVTGLICRTNDEDAFVEALKRLLRDDAERSRLARNSPASVQRYSWETTLGVTRRDFENLAGG